MTEDLNDLRLVAAIAETGSLAGAALRLAVNHATVFRRLSHLEKRIGVRLFERSGGRYQSTPAGEELARAGALMNDTAERALLKIAGRDLRPSGVVRISTTDSVALKLLHPVMVRCREQYPQIALCVDIDNKMVNLSRRDADIAIRPTRSPPEHLVGMRIATVAFGVYGARDYLAATSDKPLDEHEWIALDESQSQHRTLRWLERIKPLDEAGYRINSFGGAFQACLAGLGLALLPSFLGDSSTALARVGALVPECASELWLLTHPDLRGTTRVRAVYQLLQAELGKAVRLLEGESAPSPAAHSTPDLQTPRSR